MGGPSVSEFMVNNGKVTNIPYENVNLNKIVNSYFNEEKPFGKGKKKHEFPYTNFLSKYAFAWSDHTFGEKTKSLDLVEAISNSFLNG